MTVFNLLVSYSGWDKTRGTLPDIRVFEYTDDDLVARFKPKGTLNIELISQVPALFMSEVGSDGDQMARVGMITSARPVGREVRIEYLLDPQLPAIPNALLEAHAGELGIDAFEFHRTHWAVKEADLFQVLLRARVAAPPAPKVFRIDPIANVDPKLCSIMMPFAAKYDDVYKTVQHVAKELGMTCLRADDIWEDEAIIQDVVALINRSKVVICDCTGRNPNVFYETGIAHALGRDTVLITQRTKDVPFDLRHLRHIKYENTVEGQGKLGDSLKRRIQKLREQ